MPSFSHMENVSFLMMRLNYNDMISILCETVVLKHAIFFFFFFFFLIQFYVPVKIISAHMRRANQ